jgi:hypothetical protein
MTLYIWGRRWAAVTYDVISLAAKSLLKALHGTDLTQRSAPAPAPVGSRSIVFKMKKLLEDGLDLP